MNCLAQYGSASKASEAVDLKAGFREYERLRAGVDLQRLQQGVEVAPRSLELQVQITALESVLHARNAVIDRLSGVPDDGVLVIVTQGGQSRGLGRSCCLGCTSWRGRVRGSCENSGGEQHGGSPTDAFGARHVRHLAEGPPA